MRGTCLKYNDDPADEALHSKNKNRPANWPGGIYPRISEIYLIWQVIVELYMFFHHAGIDFYKFFS